MKLKTVGARPSRVDANGSAALGVCPELILAPRRAQWVMIGGLTRMRSFSRLWSTFEATPAGASISLRSFFLGQFLALLAALATLATHLVSGPLFSHSVYLFCLPALVICATLGGFPSAMSTTVILAAGAFVADLDAQLPAPERLGRVALFLVLGLSIAFAGGRLRRAFWDSRQRSERLNEREAILRSSLDAFSDALVVVDETGVIITFMACGASARSPRCLPSPA